MRTIFAAFLTGLVFGIGLVVSQMVNPAKVLNFLDVAGSWDPSLALVMVGAIAVTGLGYKLVLKQPAPVFAERFQVPTRQDLDARLLSGAAIFGIGWGLVGLCPGPALTVLGTGRGDAFIFAAAMFAGFFLNRLLAGSGGKPMASSAAS